MLITWLKQKKEVSKKRNLQNLEIVPIPKATMRLYAILAVILILIPEWIAELTITLENIFSQISLPKRGLKWEEDIELRLAKMTFKELRLLAEDLAIKNYSRDTKQMLFIRLLKKLNK